jgi:hypothetical protein
MMSREFLVTIKGTSVANQIGLFAMEISVKGSMNQPIMLQVLTKLAAAFDTCLREAGNLEEAEVEKTLKIDGKDVKFEAKP